MTSLESVVRTRPIAPSGAERRVHLRAHLDGPVLVDAMSSWQRARCDNVSEGGVALACDDELPVGRTVELYFELPCGVAIEARALVVRSTRASAGLRFLELDRRSEMALRHHCRSSMRPPAAASSRTLRR